MSNLLLIIQWAGVAFVLAMSVIAWKANRRLQRICKEMDILRAEMLARLSDLIDKQWKDLGQ